MGENDVDAGVDWARWEQTGEGQVRLIENASLGEFKLNQDGDDADSLPISIGFDDANGASVAAAELWRAGLRNRWGKIGPIADHRSGEAIYGGILFRHFGHFLLESLARFWFISRHPDLPIVWHARDAILRNWQVSIFELLGVEPSRFHLVTRPTSVQRILVPDPGLQIKGGMWSGHGNALGRFLIGPTQGRRIWLSRSLLRPDARLRSNHIKIANEDILEAELVRRGWEIVHPQHLTLPLQLAALKGAEIIAGIEGSALHLLMLCGDIDAEVRIVSRNPKGKVADTYHHIAAAKRFRQSVVPKRAAELELFDDERRFADVPKLAAVLDQSPVAR